MTFHLKGKDILIVANMMVDCMNQYNHRCRAMSDSTHHTLPYFANKNHFLFLFNFQIGPSMEFYNQTRAEDICH